MNPRRDASPAFPLESPFPYFGGKRKIAPAVWRRLGSPRQYIEPFAGSLAVLLNRPDPESAVSQRGTTAVFLDPPYGVADRSDVYACESRTVSGEVRAWAIDHGDWPSLRIAVCGYEGEHAMPGDWECMAWSATGGWGNQRKAGGNVNRHRERIWFSPHCLRP